MQPSYLPLQRLVNKLLVIAGFIVLLAISPCPRWGEDDVCDVLMLSPNSQPSPFVIPAKAGIQLAWDARNKKLDPGFRRGDASR
jgi:hypothetical protein